ncbi:MAG: MFS transporter [Chitinophagaceae bacterium]|nr:MFS transporter [Chitinophagaceae bacterium]
MQARDGAGNTHIKQPRIFYGWVVLAGLFIMYAASNGIGVNTMPLFNPQIAATFGLDIAGISKLVGYFWILLALPLPFIGRLLDRLSARLLITAGAVGLAGCMLLLGRISNYGMLVAFYVLYPVFLSFCGMLSGMYILNQWFARYKGIAIGIYLMASSIGGAVFPRLAGHWIQALGWQQAAWYTGTAGAFCMLLPLLFIRNKPADKCTWPDGIAGTAAPVVAKNKTASGKALGRALKSPGLFLLVVTTALLWFVIIGFQANQGFLLNDLHLSAARSGTVISLFFICSVAGKLLFGWLCDRYNKKGLMVLSIAILAIGCTLLWQSLKHQGLLQFAVVVLGIGFAGTFTMIQLFVAYLYTGPAYGGVLGIVTFADTLASAAGAVVVAGLRKSGGGFELPFKLLILLSGIALVTTLFIKKSPHA